MQIDHSTIDVEKLAQLCPVYTLPPGFKLQENPGGNGCYGDPPGYPTYFTRAVYTSLGNSPNNEPVLVLHDRAVPVYVGNGEVQKNLWAAIYRPLPIDHPRVVAWIRQQFRHLARCYRIPPELADLGDTSRQSMMIWPIPGYKLARFVDNPGFSEEYRTEQQALVDAKNAEYTTPRRPYSTPAHHVATISVRKFYPDFSTEAAEALIASPPKELANWWERCDVPPEPGQCPGDRNVRIKHTDEHCQFCGGLGNTAGG